jgi:hypothetical protein
MLHCSVFFYTAVTEFVFGPVDRGMTESEPSIIIIIIIIIIIMMMMIII